SAGLRDLRSFPTRRSSDLRDGSGSPAAASPGACRMVPTLAGPAAPCVATLIAPGAPTVQASPEPLVTRNAPYTVPVESGAAVLAPAAPGRAAVHAGAPLSALAGGPVPSVAPAPVLSPVPSSLPFSPPLPVPSISSEEPPAVLAPLSGPLPWLVPPCACEAWPTADGLASEPEEVDTCT